MNALEKRNEVTRLLALLPMNEQQETLSYFSVTRSDIGKNAPAFSDVRDAMLEALTHKTAYTIETPKTINTMSSPTPSAPSAAELRAQMLEMIENLEKAETAEKEAAKSAPAGGEFDEDRIREIVCEEVVPFAEGLTKINDRISGVAKGTDENFSKVRDAVEECKKNVDIVHTGIREIETDFKKKIEALNDALTAAAPAVKARVKMAVSAMVGGASPARALMAKHLAPHANHEAVALLLIGGSGTGKSYDAEQHAKSFDYAPAPFACSPVTEKFELFGCVTQTESGLGFGDGFISAGIRAAMGGASVCLILDELPRLSSSLQMELLTLLTPRFNASGDRVYSLRTGRQMINPSTGVCEPEIISCACEKLAFVATGNIGSNFGVRSGGIDEAVYKRFLHLRVNWDSSHALGIFRDVMKSNGLDDRQAEILIEFVEKSRELAQHGDIAYGGCVRTVTRSINLASSMSDLRGILQMLCTETLSGWERDGSALTSNVEACKSILFPILAKLK